MEPLACCLAKLRSELQVIMGAGRADMPQISGQIGQLGLDIDRKSVV
jgi:hypothetical protein